MKLSHAGIGVFMIFILLSCKTSRKEDKGSDNETYTPVSITHITIGSIKDIIELNAVSSFLYKTPVKSDINGYIEKVNVMTGEKVIKGQELFIIRSKEAEHLGKTLNKLDTSVHFSGLIHINAPAAGYITQLVYGTNDYVQDGDVIAVISDINNFVFLLELPYELKPYLSLNKMVEITLPDGEIFKGILSSPLPSVDPASQTQRFMIHFPSGREIPENLVARVKYIKKSVKGTVLLPKEAILSDEEQSKFWIMKMIDSNTAVKIIVKKGIEENDTVEVLSPPLTPADQILISGNYGLPDTAKVIIENK